MKSSKGLIFRQSTWEDLDRIFEIKKSGLKKYVKKNWGWDEEEQINIHRSYFKPESTTIIAHKGQDIGYLVKNVLENELCIENLILKSEFQNLGFGTQIIQLIIEECKITKRAIRLKVFKINQRAIKFYVKMGFDKISETQFHFVFEKTPLNQFITKKLYQKHYII